MKLLMKEDEVLQSYREAKNKLKQVGILADLNCVTNRDMARWLLDHGQDVAKTYKLEPKDKAEESIEPEAFEPEAFEDEIVGEFEELHEAENEADEKLCEPKKCVLTADQAYSVAEFIDTNIFSAIRTDNGCDSLQALKNIIYAYDEMCSASGYKGATEKW